MVISRLRASQFRCYEELTIEPDKRFNVISGLNGQGKTSILEAAGLACFLKSFRSAKNQEMIHFGQDQAKVDAQVIHKGIEFNLGVLLWDRKKLATINSKKCKYLSEYVGKVSAVSFCPADLEMIRGGPVFRRGWMDKIAQIYFSDHVDLLSRYMKVLEHRNRQLKLVADGRKQHLEDDFSVWTDELVNLGAQVIHNRIHSVDNSVDKSENFYRKISARQHDIKYEYFSEISAEIRCRQPGMYSLEVISQAFKEELKKSEKKELILGTTSVGPHRDDLSVYINGSAAREFGSQGEIRSIVLAMRLTEVELYKSLHNIDPILLIDDFSSELDVERRRFLLDYLYSADSQVFLSTTENLSIGKTFQVSEGKVTSNDHRYISDGFGQLQC